MEAIASNEAERLAALHDLQILDTLPEPHFDAICRTASALFSVPISTVALIDTDRQWQKARHGLMAECSRRDIAFCAHAILSDEPLIVADATQDARFAANPFVTGEPGIRFYAGAPLILRPDIRVGTLCIIDTAPRTFSDAQVRQLQDLASIVVAHLRLHEATIRQEHEIAARESSEAQVRRQAEELREREAALQESNRLLVLAEEIAQVGHFSLVLPDQQRVWSDEVYRIFGLDPQTAPPHLLSTRNGYHPDDQGYVRDALLRAVADRKAFSFEARVLRPCGAVRHVVVRGTYEESQADQPSTLVGVVIDVTERVEREQALRTSEERLRISEERLALALDSGSDGLWDWDITTGEAWFSDRWYEMLGYERGEIASNLTSWQRLAHPEDAERAASLMQAHLKGTVDAYECEFRLLTRSGLYVWVLVRGKVVCRSDDGRALRMVGTQIDISRRKQAEEAVAESELRYRTLADALPQLVWIFSPEEGEAVYVNQQFRKYYGSIGTSRAARLSRNHPDDAARMEKAWRTAWRLRSPYTVEGRLQRHDGVYRWHKLVMIPIRQGGHVTAVLGSALDIDDIITARQKLEQATHLLRVAQDAANAGTWELDLAAEQITWSPESARLHGIDTQTSHVLSAHEWLSLIDRQDGEAALAAAGRAADTHTSFAIEFRVPQADGSVRWVNGTGRALYDASGKPTRMVGLNIDITHRKVAERMLMEAKAAADAARREAERASAAKSEFLAAMSHEIRTPLNGVLGYADLLLEQPELGPTARQYGERIQSAGSALLTVVNDILDFSKVEAGEVRLHPEAFPLAGLIDNTISIVRSSAECKGVALTISLDEAVPAYLLGDQSRLRQVLLNLLNNAIKFTARGSVSLGVGIVTRDTETVRLRFTVQDTGIGIPTTKHHLLFERFSQVDGSIQREFGGTGLGLAISKRLVSLMGGEIGVESETGRGSTFWFEVPLTTADPQAQPRQVLPEASERRGCRLLLVEDVPLNQELACAILKQGGHEVDVVASGPEAIQAVQGKAYDLVLMDVQMPGMDGLTATRHIRALEHPSASVPIIALTANVLPQQVAAFRKAGMNDHVGKPFKREALFVAIGRWAKQPDTEPPSTAPPAASASGALDQTAFAEVWNSLGPEAAQRLLGKLAEELEARFGESAALVSREELARSAHAMVGMSGVMGFLTLSRLCSELEEACASGDEYRLLLDRLHIMKAEVLAEISTLVAP